jgi:NADH:ubiquinone oxidoreductase subunit 6 (subunit J)
VIGERQTDHALAAQLFTVYHLPFTLFSAMLYAI